MKTADDLDLQDFLGIARDNLEAALWIEACRQHGLHATLLRIIANELFSWTKHAPRYDDDEPAFAFKLRAARDREAALRRLADKFGIARELLPNERRDP